MRQTPISGLFSILSTVLLLLPSVYGISTTITIQGNNLGQDPTLLLFFTPPNDTLTTAQPLAWKVFPIPSVGTFTVSGTYTAHTAFFVPSISSGNLVTATDSQLVDPGQSCTAQPDSAGNEVITNVGPGTAGKMTALNNGTAAQDIGIGFADSTGLNLQVALLWKSVGVKSSVVATFHPTVLIYAYSQYQQTQIISGEIDSPLLYTQDMGVGNTVVLNLSFDKGTGTYSLTPASSGAVTTTKASSSSTGRATGI